MQMQGGGKFREQMEIGGHLTQRDDSVMKKWVITADGRETKEGLGEV